MGRLVFLLILIVATTVLIAWLLVELARFVLGDLRFERVRHGSLQVAAPESRLPPRVPGPERHAGPRATPAPAEPTSSERVLYDEADVEQAIRDRLYGSTRRRGA